MFFIKDADVDGNDQAGGPEAYRDRDSQLSFGNEDQFVNDGKCNPGVLPPEPGAQWGAQRGPTEAGGDGSVTRMDSLVAEHNSLT